MDNVGVMAYNGEEDQYSDKEKHLENINFDDSTNSPNDNVNDNDNNDDDDDDYYNDDYYYDSEYDKSKNENIDNVHDETQSDSILSATGSITTPTTTTTASTTIVTDENTNSANDEHEMLVLNQKYTLWPYENINANNNNNEDDDDTINESTDDDTIGAKYMSVDNDELVRSTFKKPSAVANKMYNNRNGAGGGGGGDGSRNNNKRKSLLASKKYITATTSDTAVVIPPILPKRYKLQRNIERGGNDDNNDDATYNFYSNEDTNIRTAKELIDDMERIMKNDDSVRLSIDSEPSLSPVSAKHNKMKFGLRKKGHGACFTGVDSYFHYSDAETMRQVISYKIDLNLRFKTHSSNGLLLWTGRHSAMKGDDFLSLGIENG